MLDEFNLKGLSKLVPNMGLVLAFIVNYTPSVFPPEVMTNAKQLQHDAELLYGLLHTRYIQTECGMNQMVSLQFDHG